MRWTIGDYPRLEGEPAGGKGTSTVDIEATVQRLLDSKGDKAAVGELLRDNFRQREEIRQLKDKLDAAPKVPEGGLVLKADEAKAWTAYQALGKPEDVKKSLDQKVELEQKVQSAEKAEGRRAVAELLGWKDSVLAKLPGADQLKYEVREETVDGEKVKVAYITEPTQGATPKKLTDHADAAWKDFLPALEADADEGGAPREARKPANSGGTEFIRQQPTGSSGRKKTEEDVRKATRQTVDYSL